MPTKTFLNPAARMKPRVKEQSRDRVLTSKEIKAFWNNLDKLPAQPAVRAALRLILVTAQRPGEIVNLEWSEINQDEDGATWWTIPSRKSKNNLSHRVPLSGLAIEVLETMPRKDAGFVFASSHNGAKGVTRHALSKALNVNQELMSIEDFHPHDLRRSAASYMTGMGISRLVVSKILNHVETGITAVYDRHAYDAEKRTSPSRAPMRRPPFSRGARRRSSRSPASHPPAGGRLLKDSGDRAALGCALASISPPGSKK